MKRNDFEHNGLDQAMALSDMYALLAVAYRFPTLELAEGLCDGSYRKDCMTTCETLGIALGNQTLGALDAYLSKRIDKPQVLFEEMRKDYTRLYIAPHDTAIPIYESLYRSRKRGDSEEILLFVNDCTMHVAQLYRKAGVHMVKDVGEPEDHLSVEFEFMRYLYLCVARSLRNESSEEYARYFEMLREFEDVHLSQWVEDFMQESKEAASAPVYRTICDLGSIFYDCSFNPASKSDCS